MKRDVTLVGKQTYESNYNGQNYRGTRLYCAFKDPSIDGDGTMMFKISENRYEEFDLDNLKVRSKFTVIYTNNANGSSRLEAILT